MRFLKKAIAAILALSLVMSLTTVGVAATTDSATFYVSESTDVIAGAEATFTVAIKNNRVGFAVMVLEHTIKDAAGNDVTASFEHGGTPDRTGAKQWLDCADVLKYNGEAVGTLTKTGDAISWNDSYNTEAKDGNVFTMKLIPSKQLFNGTYTLSFALSGGQEGNFAYTPSAGKAENVPVAFEDYTFTLSDGVDTSAFNPTLTANPTSTTYPTNTATLTASATALTGSTLSYKWYKSADGTTQNGEEISGATDAAYTPELAFGENSYYCVVTCTFSDGRTFAKATNVVAVTYNKATLPENIKLTPPATEYTGSEQTVTASIEGVAAGEYTIDAASLKGTDVGEYKVTATAKEDGNYTGTAEGSWKITPAEITGGENVTMNVYTNGQIFPIPSLNLVTKGTGNTPEITYEVTEGDDLVELVNGSALKAKVSEIGETPKHATVTAKITAPNHKSATRTIGVTVTDKINVSGKLDFTEKKTEETYKPEGFKLSDLVTELAYKDDFTADPNATVKYYVGSDEHKLDDTVVLNASTSKYIVKAVYDDPTRTGTATVEIEIKPIEIDTTAWSTWTGPANNVYDSAEKEVTFTVPTEQQNLVTVASYTDNKATDAGSYTAVANLALTEAAGSNYTLKKTTVEHTWTIAKADKWIVELPELPELPIQYSDQTVQSVTAADITALDSAKLKDVEITKVESTGDIFAADSVKVVNGEAQFALKHYEAFVENQTGTITVTFTSKNYKDSTATLKVTVINKKDVSYQVTFTFPAQTATYNGAEQGVAAAAAKFTGTPSGTGKLEYLYKVKGSSDPFATKLPKDAGTYLVQAIYEDDTQRGTAEADYVIAKAPLTVAGATVADKPYDATNKTATVNGVTFGGTMAGETLAAGTDYTATGEFADANAGTGKTVNVTVTLVPDGPVAKNYTLGTDGTATCTATANITRKAITPTVTVLGGPFTFDNTPKEPAVEVKDGEIDLATTDYEVKYADNINAGTAKVTVTAPDTGNYEFGLVEQTFTIDKGAAHTFAPVNKVYKYDSAVQDDVKLPTITNGGEITYTPNTPENTILDSTVTPTVNNGVLTFKLAGQNSFTPDQSVTIPVMIVSDNYKDSTVNVVITLTDKNVPEVSANDIPKTYDGKKLTDADITGTATFEGAPVGGTWSLLTDPAGMVNASGIPYNAAVKFTPDDPDTYAEVETQITVTISKATPAVAVDCEKVTAAGKTLADCHLTCTATDVDGQPLPGTVQWDDPETEIVPNTEYGWTFTPADTANYEKVTGKLTPFLHTEPDGISANDIRVTYTGTALTDADITGTASVAGYWHWITNPASMVNANENGYTAAVEFVPSDLTHYTPVQRTIHVYVMKDTPVVAPKYNAYLYSGQTLSSAGLSCVSSPSGTIAWELPVNTFVQNNGYYTWIFTPDDTANYNVVTGQVQLFTYVPDEPDYDEPDDSDDEQPVTPNPVKPDPTEPDPVKPDPVDPGAIKPDPVDPGQDVELEVIPEVVNKFEDLDATDWYAGAVSQVVERGLFNGVSETEFSPDTNMTRSMLVTVLWRLEGSPVTFGGKQFSDVKDGQYYTVPVAWASENSIVNGLSAEVFGVNNDISREQLVTILYRYAQSKNLVKTSGADLSSYSDAFRVSDYARDAMAWAVEIGLITGMGDGTLNPGGSATRAQVATFIMRYAVKFAA